MLAAPRRITTELVTDDDGRWPCSLHVHVCGLLNNIRWRHVHGIRAFTGHMDSFCVRAIKIGIKRAKHVPVRHNFN